MADLFGGHGMLDTIRRIADANTRRACVGAEEAKE